MPSMSDTRQESDNSALVSAVLLSLTAIPVVARPQKVRAFVQKITADAPQASILNFISEDARLRRQPPPAREGRDGVLPVKASLAALLALLQDLSLQICRSCRGFTDEAR